jgi:hypothetical protein
MGPVVSHLPCDLNQQRKRYEARKDKVAKAAARRNGRRSLLDRLLRRSPEALAIVAEDLERCEPVEDVYHSFRF